LNVDEKISDPLIVMVGTSISNRILLNVTVISVGITIEHEPDGTCSFSHVSGSSKSPDWTALQMGMGVVVSVV